MAEGKKLDEGKLRFDLIPPRPLEMIAQVYTIGAKKYADRNWEKGIQYGRLFAAMMRHAWKWWKGEELDTADGQHHLASVAWCAIALMEYSFTHTEMDDRPYSHGPLGGIAQHNDGSPAKGFSHYKFSDPCKQCDSENTSQGPIEGGQHANKNKPTLADLRSLSGVWGPIPCGEDIPTKEDQWRKEGQLSKLYPRAPK